MHTHTLAHMHTHTLAHPRIYVHTNTDTVNAYGFVLLLHDIQVFFLLDYNITHLVIYLPPNLVNESNSIFPACLKYVCMFAAEETCKLRMHTEAAVNYY